jgi:hypothetical protein
VPGVVSALKTHDSAGPIRQQIYDLTLAFITPLGAKHNNILTH